MKIEVNQLKQASDEELAVLHILKRTPNIEQAISLLKLSKDCIMAEDIASSKLQKLWLADILYVEYLERHTYVYSKKMTCVVKISFTNFLTKLSAGFVQISKNTAVNIYHVKSIEPTVGANLRVKTSSDETLIVSRRYIKKLKLALNNLLV